MGYIWIRRALLLGCGVLLGVGIDRSWHSDEMLVATQQQQNAQGQRAGQLPTMESIPTEVALLKSLMPSNSHIMMDVQFHWTNLWFAAQAKNWPLAQYFFNEAHNHIQWLVKKSPTMRSAGPGREDVNIEGIFEGIDSSSLADVKAAIEKKDSVQFAAVYPGREPQSPVDGEY